MSIQHRDIPNAQLHEPKDITTALNRASYFANGSGSGAWRLVTEEEISYTDKTKNKFGWNDISDSLYTSGAPRAILSGVRTQLTNNGLAAQSDSSRLGSIWNNVSNQFTINDLNAAYELRINFKATAAAAAGTPYICTMEIESSNGPLVFSSNTLTIKGGGGVNHMQMMSGFYSGTSINNYNTKIYITPDTNINIYDIGFFIRRTYKEV
jgi:hypothetical protein